MLFQVGDPLALRFEIFEKNSPYELFIRELVALDGTDSSEITLIDEHGCPTDQEIMGPALKVNKVYPLALSCYTCIKPGF